MATQQSYDVRSTSLAVDSIPKKCRLDRRDRRWHLQLLWQKPKIIITKNYCEFTEKRADIQLSKNVGNLQHGSANCAHNNSNSNNCCCGSGNNNTATTMAMSKTLRGCNYENCVRNLQFILRCPTHKQQQRPAQVQNNTNTIAIQASTA